jgi:hypothetical protein
MIIGRIQKGIEMSSLRSKTLIWVGILWPYGLGIGPRASGGGAQHGAGSNTALASGGGGNPARPNTVGAACPTNRVTPGLSRCCWVKPTGLGVSGRGFGRQG